MTSEDLPTSRGATDQQHRWVMVVSSSTHLRTLLLHVLEQAGYVGLGCATISEAEPILHRVPLPRLILFDAAEASAEMLPQRLQQLYALLPLAEALCPMLVLSAMHPPPCAHSLPGRVKVVVKPFNLAHLMDLVTSQMALPETLQQEPRDQLAL